jgi:hypothetical protein
VASPLHADLSDRFNGLRRLIGNTPLLAIDYTFRGRPGRVFAKSENLNMTGSVKDRMALHILHRAYQRGVIQPGDRIIEATSGNTGISFAAVGRALGHPVSIFMPDWMSSERVNLLRSFGVDLRPVSHDEGGFLGSIELAEHAAAESGAAFLPRQFDPLAAEFARAVTRRLRGRRGHRRNRDGGGVVPSRAVSTDHRSSPRAVEFADAVDRSPGRQTQDSGHLGRVHPSDRGPRRSGRHRRGRRR